MGISISLKKIRLILNLLQFKRLDIASSVFPRPCIINHRQLSLSLSLPGTTSCSQHNHAQYYEKTHDYHSKSNRQAILHNCPCPARQTHLDIMDYLDYIATGNQPPHQPYTANNPGDYYQIANNRSYMIFNIFSHIPTRCFFCLLPSNMTVA